MQTSGTAPQLSDGSRKAITTPAPKFPAPRPSKPVPQSKAAGPAHRRGGFAKHQKGGR